MKIKSFLILVSIYLLTNSIKANIDTVSVTKAFNTQKIKLSITGKGGYQGSCISMNIKNQFTDSLMVFIEAGKILDSKDSTEQNILIVKDIFIPLASNQQKQVDVTGFCCQAHNGAPKAKSIFSISSFEIENLYKLGRYLNKAKLKDGSIQSAVWCLSDNNELSSIVDDGTEEVASLRKFIAAIKKLPIENFWYSIHYKEIKNQLFSGVPEKVTGHFDYYISDFSHVFVTIRDVQGTIVKSFEISKAADRGSYTYNLSWNVGNNPPGDYTVRIYQDERELKKLSIQLK